MKDPLSNPLRTVLLSFVAALSLLLLHLNFSLPFAKYRGFAPIQWGEGCVFGSDLPLPESSSSYLLTGSGRCVSDPFVLVSERVEVELALSKQIAKKKSLKLFVLTEPKIGADEGHIAPLTLSLSDLAEGEVSPKRWMSPSFQLPPHLVGHSIRLEFRLVGSKKSWILLRGRVNFLSSPLRESRFLSALSNLKSSFLSVPLFFFFAASSLALLLGRSKKGVLLAFLLLGPGVHLRFTPYYYFDEWDLLARFFQEGFLSVSKPHGEHFVPAFLLAFFSQVALFGERYWAFLLLSHVFHLLNVWLFFSLLSSIFGDKQPKALLLLAGMYCVNGANAEVLQWGVTQSILFGNTAFLIALLFGARFFRSGKWIHGAVCVVGGVASPLFFSSGYLVLPFLLGVLWFTHFSPREAEPRLLFGQERIVDLKKAAMLLSVLGVVLGGMLWLHLVSVPSSPKRPSLPVFFWYVLSGSQVGTVLRGFGMIPSASLEAVHTSFLRGIAQILSPHTDPLIVFGVIGLCLSLSLLYFTAVRCGRRHLALALLANLLLFLCFTLQALGRWQFGNHQSLALRYQNLAVMPFVWSIAPLVINLSTSRLWRGAVLLGTVAVASHVFIAFDCKTFERSGAVSQMWFIKQQEAINLSLPNHLLPMLSSSEVADFPPPRIYSALDPLKRFTDSDGFLRQRGEIQRGEIQRDEIQRDELSDRMIGE